MDVEPRFKTEVDIRSRSPSAEPVDLPEGIQDTVDVICGDAIGLMDIRRARILFEGQDISPTELEKIGGRGASKKWKTSLRVINADGKPGKLVGDWLQSQGLDIRHSQLVRYTGKPSPPPASRPQRPVVRPPVAKAQPAVRTVPTVKPSKPVSALKPQPPSVDLLAHLQSQYIGFIPGDPTVDGVPAELPASSVGSAASDVTVIHMNRISHEELMKMSRDSATDPLGALLPNQPGILPEREAHLTGHQPAKKSRVTPAADVNEAAALIGDYMAGRMADPPWRALGHSKAPLICGVDLNLHQLYKAVQSHGGFEATISNKCWGKVATKLGIDKSTHTNASFVLKNAYTRYLLAYETQVRALRGSSEELAVLDEPEDQPETQVPTDTLSGGSLQDAPAKGSCTASKAEDASDGAAARAREEATEAAMQTAHVKRDEASDSGAKEAAESSGGADLDDRLPPEDDSSPAADSAKDDEAAPSVVSGQIEQPTMDLQEQSRDDIVVSTSGLEPDPGNEDVEMDDLTSSPPDFIALD
ncbi:hypothetical protein WJX75_005988 [Coccomyxa subellipsoidea]|uniref:ARID domain-containing protein n=1 Tax=Coccomyxa subellipsoidea TaxID=248742 RepID=A0ABR2YN41_9CHLO